MPSKVKFRFEFDENQDQALLGDLYSVLVTFEPEADITMSEITLIVDGVEVETQIIGGSIPALGNELDSGNNLMQSQAFDESFMSRSATISTSSTSRSMTVLRNNVSPPKIGADALPSDIALISQNSQQSAMFVSGHGQGENGVEIYYNLNPSVNTLTDEDRQQEEAKDVADLKMLNYSNEETKSVKIPL